VTTNIIVLSSRRPHLASTQALFPVFEFRFGSCSHLTPICSVSLFHDPYIDPNELHRPSESSRHTLNPTGARASERGVRSDFNYPSKRASKPISECPDRRCQPSLSSNLVAAVIAVAGINFLLPQKPVRQHPRDRPSSTMPGASVAAVPAPANASSTPASRKTPLAPERKYKCQFCARAFSRSEHRSRHERSRMCTFWILLSRGPTNFISPAFLGLVIIGVTHVEDANFYFSRLIC
jgi:hypothetical protein